MSRRIPNLHVRSDKRNGKTYYSYRDPRTGKDHGLGTDREAAISDAIGLNAAIYASIRTAMITTLTASVNDTASLNRLVMRHLELCERRALAKNTIRTRKCHAQAWMQYLGADRALGSISVQDIAGVIRQYEDAGKDRTALAMRTTAVELWKDAIAEGWVNDNIAAKTRATSVTVQRSRLTLDDFNLVYAAAAKLDPWTRHSMAIALVSAQRREDIANFEFRHRADSTAWLDAGSLFVIQRKTGNRVSIPLDIGIAGFVLADAIKACRRDGIISRWMVHHQRRRTKSLPGDQVWVDTISKGFSRARDLAGVAGEPGKSPPTFHEIRSLSIRLYTAAYGKDLAQAIAGHKDAATTDLYRDTRGTEWVAVRLAAPG